MTPRTAIILLSVTALLPSCNSEKRNDRKMEKQANRMMQLLDSSALQLLDGWDYMQRGQNSFWSRLSGDTMFFNCSFYPAADTPKLTTYQVQRFLARFKSSLQVDTAYSHIQLAKTGDTVLRLTGTDHQGKDHVLSDNLSLNKIFSDQDPFILFGKLAQLRDAIGVIGISHYHMPGSFTQFYLPGGQHILTHIPDSLLNSDKLNQIWKTEFSKGKQIKPGWNYRKLEHPIDGG